MLRLLEALSWHFLRHLRGKVRKYYTNHVVTKRKRWRQIWNIPEDQNEREVHVAHEVASEHARLFIESLDVAGDGVEEPRE